jgi:hypothetical protein
MTEARKPETAGAEGEALRADGPRGPRPEEPASVRAALPARELPKELAMDAPARRLEALQPVALDSDRSSAIDHSLEM